VIRLIGKFGPLSIVIMLFAAIFKGENLVEIVKMLGIPIAIVVIWTLIEQFIIKRV
jgi:branched-subunit amino acid transport protein AzlD